MLLALRNKRNLATSRGLPYSSDGKESACKAGDPGSIPRTGRYPGEGNGNWLQYSFHGISIGNFHWKSHGKRSLGSYSPWGSKESEMTKWLSTHTQWLHMLAPNSIWQGCCFPPSRSSHPWHFQMEEPVSGFLRALSWAICSFHTKENI